MYTVKRAAQLVGVSESTLRAWERRYGLAPTARSAAGYRLYDDATVRHLTLMHGLILEGWAAREAAAEVQRRVAPSAADVTASGSTGSDLDALTRVAASFDAVALDHVLNDQFTRAPFEDVVDGWLLPSLVKLGDAWETGEVSVAGEHIVSGAVGRRLAAIHDALVPSGNERVVIGLPPGARHDLGLLAFATAARRAGLSTTYLGADVPAESWAKAVETDCQAAVLAVPRRRDVKALVAAVESIREVRPELLIAVGGSQQERAPEGCVQLGHEVGAAARRLAELVSS